MPERSPRGVTLINAFEVPADADGPFIAGWERARDFLAAREGFRATALHRALRPDADFRFVNVAQVDSAETWRAAIDDPAFPGSDMPFAAHPGLYEVAIEDGDVDGEGGVVLINAFEVPPEADEAFVSGWDAARGVLADKRGFLGTRLHRSLGPAEFRFVNVARWSSPLMFANAVEDPGFREAAAALPFTSHPALYQVVRH
jgi:heme-degrading monooxygenase HmoA